MKKILFFIGIVTLVVGCTNQEIEFDDYDFQGVYFPFQSPVRTIVLGDDVLGDNTIDREHAFSIGASIGGMYENTKDRDVFVEFAPELAENLDGVELLPDNYYNATFDKLTIPAGSFFGKLRVDLTDEFFEDSLTTGLKYVLPLRITDAEADSVLSGVALPTFENPDPRIGDQWDVSPKNYVLFGIKYVNATHGVYILRGERYLLNEEGEREDTVTYSQRFLTNNGRTKLSTRSLTENYMLSAGGNKMAFRAEQYSMLLTFDEDNQSVTVSQRPSTEATDFVVTNGSGKYFSKDDSGAESFNGKSRRTIYLDYTYEDDGETWETKDSLVFVDTDVTFESFEIIVTEEEEVNP